MKGQWPLALAVNKRGEMNRSVSRPTT